MDLSPDDDNFQGRLLHQAALWDNVELLQELIASGAAVDAADASGRTALHAAALAERSGCLAALCAAGAALDKMSDAATGGKTALHTAAERGHSVNVQTLVSAGARLDVRDAGGDTPLALAERNGHRHAANALREARDAQERERLSQHAAVRELVTRGECVQLRARLSALGDSAGLITNLTPGGANTLLYVASEAGFTAAVSSLLEAGADGRAHPVTKYCPLYIACYHGHVEIVKLLLAAFPEAVKQETVEKWLPLHAACIGGHASLVTLLLDHPYPPSVLNTYTHAVACQAKFRKQNWRAAPDPGGQWQYLAAFDVNSRDVSGQTALYVACTLGNLAVVDALLSHSVIAQPVASEHQVEEPVAPCEALSPQRTGISLGIHAIVSKLTGGASQDRRSERRVHPVQPDGGRPGDSCVAVAARAGHVRMLRRLLAAGANANAPAATPGDLVESTRDRRRSRSACAANAGGRSYSTDRESPWCALSVAARARQAAAADALLEHGASDAHGRATSECLRHGQVELLAKLLATKAYPDPDYKLNKSAISETVFNNKQSDNSLTYSALCPATGVVVNWREPGGQLTHIKMSWLRLAALRVNSKLSAQGAALQAITRIDVSNNELRLLPPELFSMMSLRYLNAAQNKLERLPTVDDPLEDELDNKRRKKKKTRPEVYTAPVLSEVYLQDNRLEEVPGALFRLPALQTLDASNNKIRALTPALWRARALHDLNVSLNLLRDLPTSCEEGEGDSPVSSPVQTPASSPPATTAQQEVWPRVETESADDDDDAIPTLANRTGNAVWSSARRAHAWRGAVERGVGGGVGGCGGGARGGSALTSLNLAHNQFTCVPAALACRAPHLTRLNMAYNSLRSMSYVTSYPTGLRQLDLSHNEITCWPSLPQVEGEVGGAGGAALACYCGAGGGRGAGAGARGSVRARLLRAACPARRHLRLDALRTLILANNLLTRIQLSTDDDGCTPPPDDDDNEEDADEWGGGCLGRGRLLFPLLSMLDVSANLLRAVPPAIHRLSNLSVLNLSGNKDITELPPQLGLLSRLWNLGTAGCSLGEPLRSMLAGGRYKSMDVVGYLKSVLQEARPYARMKLMLVGVQGIGKTSLLECLRQESAIQHRRKPTEHWAKRMGNRASCRGMSTVGVDIGTWVYEKQRSARGPVTFRTWDFGGQQEYYATHQYFLSRRSLYLVLWKVTEGRKGLAGAISWLRSIQARAPGSPVILVATHYDQVDKCNLPENESPECLQRLIRSAVLGAPDADKLGLPRVLDSIEVSCSTRHNIRLLADIIYSVAFSVKPPGSKEPLLEQKIPATYLALEECVTALANELKDPVLRHDEYKRLVTQYMQQKNHRMFRDAAELHQATVFLHENGVLLHYDDATLKELYFLKPQWLCDVLSHVVTVREINPFANNGIMKMEDLAHVFKASPALARREEASWLGAALLGKFELALCWDQRLLLVPPLLPDTQPQAPQLSLRSRARGSSHRGPSVGTHSPTLIQEPALLVTGRQAGASLRRLLLMSYVPRGFWPRLCVRLLADHQLADQPHALYKLPPELEADEWLSTSLDLQWGWKLWSSGAVCAASGLVALSITQLPAPADALLPCDGADDEVEHPYRHIRFRVKQDDVWSALDVDSSACIEILLPAQVCVVKREDQLPIAGYQSISLEPNPEVLAKILALVSDHVDLLLEDWYPSLGTRFVHTSEGRCLITRIVPCPNCLRDANEQGPNLHQEFRGLELHDRERDDAPPRPRLSEESRASDGDSGVGPESNASSRVGSSEGMISSRPAGTAWTVEQCVLAACTGAALHCSAHAVQLAHVAPDALLLDVPESMRARWEQVSRGALAGRGAWGTVLAGGWRGARVALKALQPVAPPARTDPALLHAYQAAMARWRREPAQAACRAYCALRQELGVLARLRHAHVAPLRAVCAAPLALLLDLAPMGSLDGVLRSYRACGVRCSARLARALALQVARALEYLHARRVVYRDLKSENVLVWQMPRAQDDMNATPLNVHVKLGDYGISRLALPSGTKGFGGTEGFMAPEIMRYNGEEEYNEKVDCFSYGMLLYEIVTTRLPFEGHEAVKEAVLEGARPALTPKELEYPCCLLETMRRCWAAAPGLRPSAGALVAVAAAPEHAALRDAAGSWPAGAAAAVALQNVTEEGAPGWEVWYGGGEPERAHTLLATSSQFTQHHTLRIPVPPDESEPVLVTAMCPVGNKVWLGDSIGRITVYSAASLALSWSVSVREAVGGARSAVSALLPLSKHSRVAVALKCGRLFLVTSHRPEAEGSFVLTELGTATELNCLAAVATPHGWEVWAGGAGLSAYSMGAGGVSGAEALSEERVSLLAAAEGQPFVASYCEPGACVQQWSAAHKRRSARLDCSKLAPCSESLQSIALDSRLDDDKCRVTALCAVRGELYVGTGWGCVVVADAATLRPVTVFRPYERDVRLIISLPTLRPGGGGGSGGDKSGAEAGHVVTFGDEYRPLVQRFAPHPSSPNTHSGYYCLLWRTQHWLPD